MIIALASPEVATSIDDGLARVRAMIARAADANARIVCFPEAYLPGLRGLDFEVPPWTPEDETRVLATVAAWAREYRIMVILGMEQIVSAGRQIVAVVIDPDGTIQGRQTKNQLDPSEDPHYVPGDTRHLFSVDGVRFGVTICHEGWRYPETVRWAAMRGAAIVFHPQHTGSMRDGVRLTEWGASGNPYYEQAMMMRSRENTIWFASVNYGLPFQESATSLIAPTGECHARLPYGGPGLLLTEVDPARATGLLARRYAPERYREG